MLTFSEIDTILENKFSIDFACIKVSSKSDQHDICYEGPGSVSMGEDGTFSMKMYHAFEETQNPLDLWSENAKHMFQRTPGQIIPEHAFYSFEGIDMSGKEWVAEHLAVNPRFSLPSVGAVITAQIKTLSCTTKKQQRELSSSDELLGIRLITKGKYDFPWNTFVKENNTTSLSECKITVACSECNVRNFNDKYIQLTKYFPLNQPLGYKVLIEAFNIALGEILTPTIIIESGKDKTTTRLFSVSVAANVKKILPPFKTNSPHSSHHFSEFVNAYCNNTPEPLTDLYNSWERCLKENQSLIENSCLILTVAIEGILKKYFSDLDTSQISKDKAEETLEKIKALNLEENIFNRIKGMLTSSQHANPKKILTKLIEDAVITKEMSKAWVSLRNLSAHADKFQGNEIDFSKIQKALNNMHTCLALLYRLIFKHVKYTGEYTDYSIIGWPDIKPETKND
jgi:hypothetical protein